MPVSEGFDNVVVWFVTLTKQLMIKPTHKTVTADQLAELTCKTVLIHKGVPSKIISDRDPCFISRFLQELFRKMVAHINVSTSAHPQTDGQTERIYSFHEQMLRCFVYSLHDYWVQFLPALEFACDSQRNASTRLFLFLAIYGFQPLNLITASVLSNTPPQSLPDRIKHLQNLH